MSFRNRVKNLIVKKLKLPNKEAGRLISEGKVSVNGTPVSENVLISPYCKVIADGHLISESHTYVYYAWYKPAGVECTMNRNIPGNLYEHLPGALQHLYHIGRLDKPSEGLLLLTNDGYVHDRLMMPGNKVEKEYLVTLDKPYDDHFLQAMASGVEIMGRMTLPCTVIPVSAHAFRIILTQGLNRQIRRMCYKLGYDVTRLIRTRIGTIGLEKMQPAAYRAVDLSAYFFNPF